MLHGQSVTAAAEVANVSRRTVYRWLDQPGFRQALQEQEGRILDTITRRLLVLADQAVIALKEVLEQPGGRGANTKRLAAVSIIELCSKLREMRTVEQRISDLEKVVYEKQQ